MRFTKRSQWEKQRFGTNVGVLVAVAVTTIVGYALSASA